jgi:predicted nucleic-acid-binding Zn-ribbon protein
VNLKGIRPGPRLLRQKWALRLPPLTLWDNEGKMLKKTQSCPGCGSHNVRESHSERLLDFLVELFNFVPFRCRHCRNRFYRRDVGVDTGAED